MQAGKIDKLVNHRHFWVETAFLRHVTNARAVIAGDGISIDENLT